MTDDLAKDNLHGQLRSTRQALVWQLDGLSASRGGDAVRNPDLVEARL